MNWFLWLILAFLLFYFIRQSMPVKGVKNIHAPELKTMLSDQDKQFIDVRTPMEFQQFSVPAFKNIPLQGLPSQCEQLDKEKEVVLICRSGSRSMRAARILKNKGFIKLTNVAGGLNHWPGR